MLTLIDDHENLNVKFKIQRIGVEETVFGLMGYCKHKDKSDMKVR